MSNRLNNKKTLVIVVVLIAVVAFAVFLLTRGDEEPKSGFVAQIEATDGACWTALVSGPGASESREESGCSSGQISLGETAGPFGVTKTTEEGTITVVALVNDEETGRQSTSDPFGSVSVTF